jgi:hypothetical protein
LERARKITSKRIIRTGIGNRRVHSKPLFIRGFVYAVSHSIKVFNKMEVLVRI